MRRLLLATATVGAMLLALAGSRSAAVAEDRCGAPPMSGTLADEERVAVDAINALRAEAGLAPLTVSPTLTRAAIAKSSIMAAGAPFDHDDPFRSWSERFLDCGYPSTFVSENIAAGSESAAQTVSLWDDSPPHRANMLHPDVRVVGIARARGGPHGWYWTADFGAE